MLMIFATEALAQITVYTDEASYLAALTAIGRSPLAEGFEGAAWAGVRTTDPGNPQTAPSVTSQGITWTGSDAITTNQWTARNGWALYDEPGGDPDTLNGSSANTLYGIGGWFVTSTGTTSIRVYVGGVTADNATLTLTENYAFIGLVNPAGFTTFQVIDTEGTPTDPEHWFSDDFTFGVDGVPANNPPNGTITSPAGDVTILAGQSVTFSGTASDPDGDPVNVLWNFGDGATSTLLIPGAHTYAAAGVYGVTFTATDSHGLPDPTPDTRTITVVNPGGITVSPTSGLVTSEAGATATFTVVLTAQPTATVSIGLSSSDTTEATIAPASLAFTTANWATPQTVTLTGVDDLIVDGTIAYTAVTAPATSADPAYSGLNAADAAASNTDNDAAGITVSPTSGLVTSEAGATATFTVVLTAQPTATVSIGLSSSDTTEATIAPASLAFTTANWATPQTVTLTGVDDLIVDGTIAYTAVTAPATSADPAYSGLNAADAAASNTDNDTSGFAPQSLTVETHGGTGLLGNLNGVWEPGEIAQVEPAWQNAGNVPASLDGTGTALVGPTGATYTLADPTASYGSIAAGATADCFAATGNCFAVEVSDPATRPATHWDATLTETLTGGAVQSWQLHIGGSFDDVPPGAFAYAYIETLLHSGITAGCSPTTYCPSATLTRWEMAVFIAKAMTGGVVPASGTVPGMGDYTCTPGGTSVFLDVPPEDAGCRYIHYIAAQSVTSGCGSGNYCPSATLTRWQMAVFIAKAMTGGVVPASGTVPGMGDYSCTPGGTSVFLDVPPEDAGCRYIHYIAAEGVTAGCGGGNYCPANPLSREQMAVFLTRAFSVLLYGP
jgi:PKD repeat protein